MTANNTISIFGPKGGVGKTLLAANFAFALLRKTRSKVLLMDLDPHDCGDIALLLGMESRKSVADLAPDAHKLTPATLENQIQRHSDGVYLLPLARELRQIAAVGPDSMEKILSVLRKIFDFIVVDCGSEFHTANVKAFEVSGLVLFLTTPEILTLSRSVQSLQEFQALAFPSDLIQIVVNRYDPRGVITDQIIRQKLRMECLALLPDEPREITDSVHAGVPLFLSQPRDPYSRVVDEMVRVILTDGLLKPVSQLKLKAPGSGGATAGTSVSMAGQQRMYGRQVDEEAERQADIRMRIHQRLIELMDFRKLSTEELLKQDDRSLAELRAKTREVIVGIIDKMTEITSREERQRLLKEVLDEALALGPLEDLLADPEVSEILVNRRDQIYVERKGKLALTNCRFTSDKHLLGVIERIVAPIGRRIDEKTPMVDARLKDGSRVHAIIPPLAIDGPMLTIRKFFKGILGPEQLIKLGAMTEDISDFLRACVQCRLNIIISGGTGTGKTTLLNVMAGYIPAHERILTVEDAAELRLPQEHVGRLEARPSNLQGEGAIPIRELVRNTLRMRPDRIIVGECRGAEALDMLQAMNTGHDGSMTTLHANSSRDCIARLETLVMFSGLDLPSRAIREQIASAIQLIVQLTRLSDGSRKITAVTEVTGIHENSVQLQDIFLFRQKGVDASGKVLGAFVATGLVPGFAELFRQRGIAMPKSLGGK
ncbi:MAG: ATPase, T2SS/T4P/T4SS family [Pseudomonadota bacterium]